MGWKKRKEDRKFLCSFVLIPIWRLAPNWKYHAFIASVSLRYFSNREYHSYLGCQKDAIIKWFEQIVFSTTNTLVISKQSSIIFSFFPSIVLMPLFETFPSLKLGTRALFFRTPFPEVYWLTSWATIMMIALTARVEASVSCFVPGSTYCDGMKSEPRSR